MGRAPCCEKVGLKKGRWTSEEDEILTNYIQANGEGSWRSLPKNAGLLRCGKSCRLRWINYLRADLRRGNISSQEEDVIIKLHASLGNRWSLIASQLPGRTDNEIKNYWNSHLSRKIDTFRRPPTNTTAAADTTCTTNTTAEKGAGAGAAEKANNSNPCTKRRGGRTSRWAMKKNSISYAQAQHKGRKYHDDHRHHHHHHISKDMNHSTSTAGGDDNYNEAVIALDKMMNLPKPADDQDHGGTAVAAAAVHDEDYILDPGDDEAPADMMMAEKVVGGVLEAVLGPSSTTSTDHDGGRESNIDYDKKQISVDDGPQDAHDECCGGIHGGGGLLNFNELMVEDIGSLDPNGLLFTSFTPHQDDGDDDHGMGLKTTDQERQVVVVSSFTCPTPNQMMITSTSTAICDHHHHQHHHHHHHHHHREEEEDEVDVDQLEVSCGSKYSDNSLLSSMTTTTTTTSGTSATTSSSITCLSMAGNSIDAMDDGHVGGNSTSTTGINNIVDQEDPMSSLWDWETSSASEAAAAAARHDLCIWPWDDVDDMIIQENRLSWLWETSNCVGGVEPQEEVQYLWDDNKLLRSADDIDHEDVHALGAADKQNAMLAWLLS